MNMMISTTGMTTATVATITPATAGLATDDVDPVEIQTVFQAKKHSKLQPFMSKASIYVPEYGEKRVT